MVRSMCISFATDTRRIGGLENRNLTARSGGIDTRRIGGLENGLRLFLSSVHDTRRIGGLEISHEAGGH